MEAEITDIVLVVRRGGVQLAAELSSGASVGHRPAPHRQGPLARAAAELPANVAYAHCPDVRSRLRRLAALPQPQLIIERGLERTGERVDTFRGLFGLVAQGGRYVVDSVAPAETSPRRCGEARRMEAVLAELAASADTDAGEHTYDVELGQSIGEVEALPRGWIIDEAGQPPVEDPRPRRQPAAAGAVRRRVG